MSIQYCHECGQNIDTDYDAEHFMCVHPTHCKYDDTKEATKQCVVCGEGLCDICGYTMRVWENGEDKTQTFCNECYNKIISELWEDKIVGARGKQCHD
jgi:hypothetical protein